MDTREYRFNQEPDDNGKAQHIHQLKVGKEWKNLIGTSSVMSVLAKPLTWWAAGLAVAEFGWTKAEDWRKLKTPELKTADLERRIEHALPYLEEIKEMSIEDYIKKLDKGYKAHSVKLDSTAESGKDLHAELERYVNVVMLGEGYEKSDFDEKIHPFIEWSEKNVKRFLWSELHCYSKTYWIGGITDCGAELNDGSWVIIDFKSSKDAYPSQFLQIAGYDIELSENGGFDSEGNKIFTLEKPISKYIIVPFGAEVPTPVIMDTVDIHKDIFLNTLAVYKWTLLT